MKVVNKDYYVLTNNTKPTEPRTYRNYFNKLLKQLDIPRLKFHGLRHSFATRCIESHCDYKTVSVLWDMPILVLRLTFMFIRMKSRSEVASTR